MKRQPPNPAAAATVAAVKAGVKAPISVAAQKTADSDRSRPATPQTDANATSKKTETKTSLKRETSDLFKSFAKSKPPKAKTAPEDGTHKLNRGNSPYTATYKLLANGCHRVNGGLLG